MSFSLLLALLLGSQSVLAGPGMPPVVDGKALLVLHELNVRLQICFIEEQAVNPLVHGTVTTKVTLTKTGIVNATTESNTAGSPKLADCIVETIEQFSAVPAKEEITVTMISVCGDPTKESEWYGLVPTDTELVALAAAKYPEVQQCIDRVSEQLPGLLDDLPLLKAASKALESCGTSLDDDIDTQRALITKLRQDVARAESELTQRHLDGDRALIAAAMRTEEAKLAEHKKSVHADNPSATCGVDSLEEARIIWHQATYDAEVYLLAESRVRYDELMREFVVAQADLLTMSTARYTPTPLHTELDHEIFRARCASAVAYDNQYGFDYEHPVNVLSLSDTQCEARLRTRSKDSLVRGPSPL